MSCVTCRACEAVCPRDVILGTHPLQESRVLLLRRFPASRVPRRPGCLWCNFSLFSAHSAHLQPVSPGMHICDRGRVVISPIWSRMCSSRLPMVQLFFVFCTFGTFATCFTRIAHLRPGPSCDIANMEPNVPTALLLLLLLLCCCFAFALLLLCFAFALL